MTASAKTSPPKKPRNPGFNPSFIITPAMAGALMRIEAARQAVETLPVTQRVLQNLREKARLFSTHYSTMIEGNRLTQEQVADALHYGRDFPGRERDLQEVKGYYAALDQVDRMARSREPVSEQAVRKLHGLVMGGGRIRIKAPSYRDGQNVIRDSRSQEIVYLPPEAKDVPRLMEQLIGWLNRPDALPIPLKAAIAHYQFATIHPYYNGNGRTARLLTTLILQIGGYGLKGIFSLEEYYARGLGNYYRALSLGPSHNYYLGRAGADITPWIAYCVEGMAVSFEKVRGQAEREVSNSSVDSSKDQSHMLRDLDRKQRRALALFQSAREIAATDLAILLGFSHRSAALLCQQWVASGFLVVANPSRKSRKYRLSAKYEEFILIG